MVRRGHAQKCRPTREAWIKTEKSINDKNIIKQKAGMAAEIQNILEEWQI